MTSQKSNSDEVTRRTFMKTTATASAAIIAGLPRVYAAGSETLRVGLIGCGGRGTGAARNCVDSSPGVQIVALGDLFQDRANSCYKNLKDGEENQWGKSDPLGKAFKVKKDRVFVGFDAYQRVIDSDVDMVILACSPHFRAKHLRAAVEAGKHVFMEKPVAVDPQGVKSVMESAELAKKKGLAIVAGTQRRHQLHYLDVMQRIKDGQIGEIRGAQCYWVGSPPWWEHGPDLWRRKNELGWSDAEYQLRNWLHYTWVGGDHIVEQHVHNLDVINWALGALPVQAVGMGGRQVRKGDGYGNIYDHFAIQYEYPEGIQVTSMCRQINGCTDMVSERIVGTVGETYTDSSVGRIMGQNPYQYKGDSPNPYEQEHADLIQSIRNGTPLNEGRQVAESTMTAILGRMSAYTGRAIKYDWAMNVSTLDYSMEKYEFGDLPEPAVAMPGITELI
ncbi:Gfo/Idh/MocA family oxidoreductase [candidate division KSB1 bacterium]|nr:Gfo/Idh/MocA family oxidoreductase [candidate division KSB1 bacterium]